MSICFCKSIQYIALQEHLVPDNKANYRAAAVTAINSNYYSAVLILWQNAQVTAIDAGVGKIVQALKEQGLYENSILVFSTDNGGSRFQNCQFY